MREKIMLFVLIIAIISLFGTVRADTFNVTTISTGGAPNTIIYDSTTIVLPTGAGIATSGSSIMWSGWTYVISNYTLKTAYHDSTTFIFQSVSIRFSPSTTTSTYSMPFQNLEVVTLIATIVSYSYQYQYASGSSIVYTFYSENDTYIRPSNRGSVTFFYSEVSSFYGGSGTRMGTGSLVLDNGLVAATITRSSSTLFVTQVTPSIEIDRVGHTTIVKNYGYTLGKVVSLFENEFERATSSFTLVVSNPIFGQVSVYFTSYDGRGLVYTSAYGWSIFFAYGAPLTMTEFPLYGSPSIAQWSFYLSNSLSLELLRADWGEMDYGVFLAAEASDITQDTHSSNWADVIVSGGSSPVLAPMAVVFYLPPTETITSYYYNLFLLKSYLLMSYGVAYPIVPIYYAPNALNADEGTDSSYIGYPVYYIGEIYLPSRTTYTYTYYYNLAGSTIDSNHIYVSGMMSSGSVRKAFSAIIPIPVTNTITTWSGTVFSFVTYNRFLGFYTCDVNPFEFKEYELWNMTFGNTVIEMHYRSVIEYGSPVKGTGFDVRIASFHTYEITRTVSSSITIEVSYTTNNGGVPIATKRGTLFSNGSLLFTYEIITSFESTITKTTWYTSTSSESWPSGMSYSVRTTTTKTYVYFYWWGSYKTITLYSYTFYSSGTTLGTIVAKPPNTITRIIDRYGNVIYLYRSSYIWITRSDFLIANGNDYYYIFGPATIFFSIVTTPVPGVSTYQIFNTSSITLLVNRAGTACEYCIRNWPTSISVFENVQSYSWLGATETDLHFRIVGHGVVYIPPAIESMIGAIGEKDDVCKIIGNAAADEKSKLPFYDVVIVKYGTTSSFTRTHKTFTIPINYYDTKEIYSMRIGIIVPFVNVITSFEGASTVVIPYYTTSLTVYKYSPGNIFFMGVYASSVGEIQSFGSAGSGIAGASPVAYAREAVRLQLVTAYKSPITTGLTGLREYPWIGYGVYIVYVPCSTCTETSTALNVYYGSIYMRLSPTHWWGMTWYMPPIKYYGSTVIVSGKVTSTVIIGSSLSVPSNIRGHSYRPAEFVVFTYYVPAKVTNGVQAVNAGAMRTEYLVILGAYYSSVFLLIFAALMLVLTKKRKYLALALLAILVIALVYMAAAAGDYIAGDYFILKTYTAATTMSTTTQAQVLLPVEND